LNNASSERNPALFAPKYQFPAEDYNFQPNLDVAKRIVTIEVQGKHVSKLTHVLVLSLENPHWMLDGRTSASDRT